MGSLIAVSSIVQGIIGVGFALIFVTVMFLIAPSPDIIPLALLSSFVVNTVLVVQLRHHIDVKDTLWMVVASVPGIAIGAGLLPFIDLQWMRWGIGFIILIAIGVNVLRIQIVLINQRISQMTAGFLSGILATLTSMGGPPLALFYLNHRVSKETFKANIVFFFFVSGIVINGAYMVMGRYSSRYFDEYWPLYVVSFIGTLFGLRVSRFVNQKRFEYGVSLFLIGIAGLLIFN